MVYLRTTFLVIHESPNFSATFLIMPFLNIGHQIRQVGHPAKLRA